MRARAFHLSMSVAVLALGIALIWAGAKGMALTATWLGMLVLGQ